MIESDFPRIEEHLLLTSKLHKLLFSLEDRLNTRNALAVLPEGLL